MSAIPEKLIYVCSTNEYKNRGYPSGVYNTFVVNFDSYQEETALRWAGKNPIIIERNNLPLTNVRLFSISNRGQNRHIFRVIIEDKYVVDLTESALFDACQGRPGVMNGLLPPVMWMVKARLALHPVHGKTHRGLVELEKRRNTKGVSRKELEIGRIYEDINGKKMVYVGPRGFSYSLENIRKEHLYQFPNKLPKLFITDEIIEIPNME